MAYYSPYKLIGVVCDGKPFQLQRLGEEVFLLTSTDSCFQIFRMDKLSVVMVSRTLPDKIDAFHAMSNETYVACKNKIIVFNRARPVRTYHEHTSPVKGFLSVGQHLISYDNGNNVKIIDCKLREVVVELTLMHDAGIATVLHPPTYLNKFLVAYTDGQLELWNFNSRKMVYSFKAHLEFLRQTTCSSSNHFDDSVDDLQLSNNEVDTEITSMETSPACDVVGLGFKSGHILLLNLKLDLVLFAFKQEGGAVTSLSFRTDASADKFPFLVSASSDGRLHVWNLGGKDDGASSGVDRKLQFSIDHAHSKFVSRVEFLPGEPVMVSSSADNSVKMWIFDSPDGSARLLRSREGHSGVPQRLRYYGGTTNVSMRDEAEASSCELVSVGTDGTVRLFNSAVEAQNREMSQNPILKKMGKTRRNERLPECVDFDFCETRQRDWGNMVTVHRDHCNVYVWRYRHRVVTELVLRQKRTTNNARKHLIDSGTFATSAAISACGNFCVVGYKSGRLIRYNLQSGVTRGTFPKEQSVDKQAKLASNKKLNQPGNVLHDELKFLQSNEPHFKVDSLEVSGSSSAVVMSIVGHDADVTGVFVDIMNEIMATSGLDGRLLFWNFNTQALLHAVPHDQPLIKLVGFRDANFVACISVDRIVRVYDLQTGKLARRFANGHSREITDLAFTPDGRRLLSSSIDGTVRVWDMTTGRCLSWLQFSAPITSLALSLSGEHLCLTQSARSGIYMYIDRSLYETVHVWQEPKVPTPVADSLVKADGSGSSNSDVATADGHEKTGDENGADATDATDNEEDPLSTSNSISNNDQRKVGAITLSNVPRAYWTTLFHLEAIKERNKPIAPPAPPVAAPFFLPTIVRKGATAPSFPTPAEYEQLTASITSSTAGASVAEVQSEKRRKVEPLTTAAAEDEATMAELANLGSVWDDREDEPDAMRLDWAVDKGGADAHGADRSSSSSIGTSKPQSRIISRKIQLPRCKLEAYLQSEIPVEVVRILQHYTQRALEDEDAEYEQDYFQQAVAKYQQHLLLDVAPRAEDALLAYLKSLSPSAVDVELRALCPYSTDVDGVTLLRMFMLWLSPEIGNGCSFDVLQAYLHRLLSIHSENIASNRCLSADVRRLQSLQCSSSDKFRNVLHKNLCLLKTIAGIPIA